MHASSTLYGYQVISKGEVVVDLENENKASDPTLDPESGHF
jgi:hypothetical protein